MIESTKKPGSTVLVIFGASGDLSQRKLVPALYNLMLDSWLPDNFAMIGVSHHERTTEDLRELLKDGVSKHSRRDFRGNGDWDRLSSSITYYKADFTNPESYKGLAEELDAYDEKWGTKASRIFYLSVSPQFIEPIAQNISTSGVANSIENSRIVVEKPFGRDYESAEHLNKKLREHFKESQIYRIDHYLGKETVQNIMAFRFANTIFEPLWNRNYIDSVQITVAETVGVEHRGNYYDKSGALRDMIQNHLLQLLCMVAMEPPITYEADEIQNRKVDVLHSVRPFSTDEKVQEDTVRGQYFEGVVEGETIEGYRDAKGTGEESNTETYAAMKVYLDNWRWKDVPFYLRTGKSMPEKNTSITIQFKPVSHKLFPSEATNLPNLLTIHIQPTMGIKLCMQAKKPGLKMSLNKVGMTFDYDDAFTEATPEAYETLLLDVMQGDSTLFMRADQVEAAWKIVMPILNYWENNKEKDFPNYAAGSWGPQKADDLLERDGRSWLNV
ncbi:glucose-6-phosphate dehydrogenase [Fulvivirga maritima]|uniref:glucose-6-phosphate dehydrogenase n=1 Tax=Fulvivirga maritima TaxID=2904247 RepID=UPI001F2FEDD7|nr:glucose-6-phosphate dehydrogenase [Fulvivirga maritima]UII29554.1 glucose-6-phosphate dehydrogenase [Fulvivirga maritima]